jgi:hypothetical protein
MVNEGLVHRFRERKIMKEGFRCHFGGTCKPNRCEGNRAWDREEARSERGGTLGRKVSNQTGWCCGSSATAMQAPIMAC